MTAAPAGSGAPWRAARWTTAARVTVTVAVTVVMGVVAFLLVPNPADLAGGSRLFGALARPGDGAGGAVGTRSGEAYGGSTLDLRVRGELGDEPVFEVPTDSPALWRGTTFDTYDGIRWTGRLEPARRLPGGPLFLLSPEAADPGIGGQLRPGLRSDEVRIKPGFRDVVFAPGSAVQVRVDAGLLRAGSGELLLDRRVAGYAVTSIPTQHDPAVLRSAGGPAAADATDPRWLALPVSLPLRVRDAAEAVTFGAATRHDAVVAVESYLRSSATYRLDSPVPGRGVDAVDDFLFVSRTGFCEQFAAAEVVMLRSAGVPARLVTGYAYGDPVDGGRLMRARNAHAWVEVWFPGIGWSASDPTAGATVAPVAATGALERAAASGRRLLADDLQRTVLAAGLVVVLLLGTVLARVAAGAGRLWVSRSWVGRRWWSRAWGGREGRTAVRSPPPRPLLAALGRLEAALREAGHPRGPAESIAELAARLPVAGEAAAAFDVLERDCFGGSPVGHGQERAAAELIDALAQRIRAPAP